jgi:Na+-driven multidrug efflux pump
MAWFLAIHLGLGIATVWWAIALTTFAKGMGLAAAFHYGSWRRRGALVDEWRA